MIIETFVFLDIHSVGYNIKEKKYPNIMELTLIAVSRKDIEKADGKTSPPLGKLSLLINPQKEIPDTTAILTGLSSEFLIDQPVFKDKINTINAFLELRKPVCLVARHGNKFDYKVLRSKYVAANAMLPKDLLCVDPATFFTEMKKKNASTSSANNSLLDWCPVTCNASFSSYVDNSLNASTTALKTEPSPKKVKITFPKTYKSIFNREPSNSQRTEVTAMMLLYCVIANKKLFVPWAEKNCKLINTIKPFPMQFCLISYESIYVLLILLVPICLSYFVIHSFLLSLSHK